MFDLVTETWNPVVGCLHDCVYCWARRLAEGKLKDTPKYRCGFAPKFFEKECERRFKRGILVFVSSMGDLFGDWVPESWIHKVLLNIEIHDETRFLLLTKNPARMVNIKFPENVVCGCTAETNRVYAGVSKSPEPLKRLEALKHVETQHKMVSVEPVMDFDLEVFAEAVNSVCPEFVYVGYDNYGAELPEPSLAKVRCLAEQLGLDRVRWKTLRAPCTNACFPTAT